MKASSIEKRRPRNLQNERNALAHGKINQKSMKCQAAVPLSTNYRKIIIFSLTETRRVHHQTMARDR